MPGFNGGLGLRDMSNLGLESCASAKGLRGVFALVSGGQWEITVVEPYDAHGTGLGSFGDEDFDYRDEYNSMFGWRARTYDQMNAGMSIRDYGGEITETLEFIPEMSTTIE